MLKERVKKLLIYCVIFSMVMQNLMYLPIKSHAMEPGEKTITLALTPNETFVIDTRYNYKIKKSEFIEYCKNYANNDNMKKYVNDRHNSVANADEINWEDIEDFSISPCFLGDGDGEYSIYNRLDFIILDDYLYLPATATNNYKVYITDSKHDGQYTKAYPMCIYDESNNVLSLAMYETTEQDDIVRPSIDEDIDFRYIDSLRVGNTYKTSNYIIYDTEVQFKFINNDTGEEILNNLCDNQLFYQGISWVYAGYCVQFSDAYSAYKLIDISKKTDTLGEEYTVYTFSVGSNITISEYTVTYIDYFTEEVIEECVYDKNTLPVIYSDSNYPIWINSETKEVLKVEDLKDGLVVYGMPNIIETYIYDYIDWYSNDFDINWILNTSNINKLDDIIYDLERIPEFDEINYPVIEIGWHLYKTSSFPAKDLKPYYDWGICTYQRNCDAIIYDGETGNILNTNDVTWSYSNEVNGININNENVYDLGELSDDSFIYELKMTDEAKELYQNLFVYNNNNCQGYYKLYNNDIYYFEEVYGAKDIINATREEKTPTCTQSGVLSYKIKYDFSNTALYPSYLKKIATKFNKENIDIDISKLSNNNITSLSTYNKYRGNFVFLKSISSFDEFANSYLLERYGIRQYESLYVFNTKGSLCLEMYPSYENGETYYNIKYDNKVLKYNVNLSSSVEEYNAWLDYSWCHFSDGVYYYPFYSYHNFDANIEFFYVTANRDNPYHTFDNASLEAQVNAIEFNLSGENDGITTVPSVFFKANEDDELYVEGHDFYEGGNFELSSPVDKLGHEWNNATWTEVDVNNISNNTDIINANSNVVDLNTLLEYAENDIDASLLNNNNKLYYKLCSRMGDAYELKIKHIHVYNEPTFTWSEDYTECIATFDCIFNDDTQTFNCTISPVTTNPTCTVNGKTVYTATVEFNDNIYTDVKEVIIEVLGHVFGEWYEVKSPTYDNEGLEQRDCIRNDASETKTINKLVKTATVNGILKDKDDKPISNKKVELHSEPRYVYTDANGYFEFKNVELGSHTLKVFNDNNSLIGEFSLSIDKIESSVDKNYISENFDWNKIINASDISLEINGLNINIDNNDDDDSNEDPSLPSTEPSIPDNIDSKPNSPGTGDVSHSKIYAISILMSSMGILFIYLVLSKKSQEKIIN